MLNAKMINYQECIMDHISNRGENHVPTMSPMVLPLVYLPVGFPPDALKSIPLGTIFALDNDGI